MPAAIWRLPERARRVIWAAAGYEPSAEQLAAHLDQHRFRLVAGGERAGKSYYSALELLCWLMVTGEGGLFWIVGPDYQLARPEFLHLVEAAGRCGLVVPWSVSMPAQGACKLTTRLGTVVETRTSAEAVKLAGFAPDGLLMVEAAQQGYDVYLQCRGRMAEKRGPMLLSGTFEGSLGWYAELWARWQGANTDGGKSFSLPTWSNLAVYPGGRNDPEIRALEATYPPDKFQERFGAVPCPPATLVFKEFRHLDHVRAIRFGEERGDGTIWLPPMLPIQLWIDPGWAGAYAVLAVAIHGGCVYVFDEVYAQGRTAQDIIAEIRQRDWWPRVRGGVIDIAGTQHQGMESHVEIWRAAGVPLRAQPVPIPDGILRHRTFLRDPASGRPRLYHDPRCKGTIREYGLYKYREVVEGRALSEAPIDADNHAMKAIAYGLVANFGFVAPPSLQKVKSRVRRG